jgi:hypothetical protein
MLRWFRRKSLKDVLNETREVKVEGVVFTIRKLSVPDHLSGAKVMHAIYEKYQAGNETEHIQSNKKVISYYRDVLLTGVVTPKLTAKATDEAGEEVSVDEVFRDWDMVRGLHDKIIEFTYGKKKLARLNLTQNA